jgi:hypothetical protein
MLLPPPIRLSRPLAFLPPISEPEALPENTYKLTIVAAGEVRDADGNLLNEVEATRDVVVTESEMNRILEGQTP